MGTTRGILAENYSQGGVGWNPQDLEPEGFLWDTGLFHLERNSGLI